MENREFYASQKLFVCFYSEPNFFSLSVLENLLSKNCIVNIIAKDTDTWKKNTYHLDKTKFGITPVGNNFVKQTYNYAIYFGGFFDKTKAYTGLEDFYADQAINGVKTLIAMPFESFEEKKHLELPIGHNTAVVYIGDLIGPRLDLDSNLFVSRNISDILFKRKITVEIGESIFPIFVYDASKIVSKWLLSFGPYGKTTFCLGKKVTATTFWKENQKLIPELSLSYDNTIQPRVIPKNFDVKYFDTDLRFCLQETYRHISNSWEERNFKAPKKQPKPKIVIKKKKIKIAIKIPRFVKPLILLIVLILITPLVTTGVGAGIMYSNYKNVVSGKNKNNENSLLLAKTLFNISKKESALLMYVPIANTIYRETYYISWLGINVSDLAVELLPISQSTGDFLGKVLGNEIYDPSEYSSKIKTALDIFYKKLSLIEIETLNQALDGGKVAKEVETKVDFDRLKTLTSKGGVLSDNLSDILGKSSKKSYLVLFQNNMELRPTGGFIGSFGIVNFQGGRMTELSINDVYSADGQLKGHVEPPAPIKNYLGEANWWLRDSNWDPDFSTSAQRAEWFLDKELDQTVDGVLAVDLNLVKEILRYTGPIFLPDYNLDISYENLYEKTQAEVHEDFFPGTHKKASFLTALSRSLLSEVTKMDNKGKIRVLKAIFENLEGRHIQAYLHNTESQNAISEVGWGGGIAGTSCGSDCGVDFLGLVEANVGVNKSNYFIKRAVDLNVILRPGESEKNLSLKIVNSANPALGVTGRYKVYLRLLVPANSNLVGVERIVGINRESLTTETSEFKGRKEIGIITEVLAGTTQTLLFKWRTELDYSKPDYGLFVRKQGGVGDDPWGVKIIPDGVLVSTPALFGLTKEGYYTYNMNLKRDFATVIKKQT